MCLGHCCASVLAALGCPQGAAGLLGSWGPDALSASGTARGVPSPVQGSSCPHCHQAAGPGCSETIPKFCHCWHPGPASQLLSDGRAQCCQDISEPSGPLPPPSTALSALPSPSCQCPPALPGLPVPPCSASRSFPLGESEEEKSRLELSLHLHARAAELNVSSHLTQHGRGRRGALRTPRRVGTSRGTGRGAGSRAPTSPGSGEGGQPALGSHCPAQLAQSQPQPQKLSSSGSHGNEEFSSPQN